MIYEKIENLSIEESVEESGVKKTYAKGIAIKAGVSKNKRNYSWEVLKKASQSMVGRPLMLNHSEDVRNIVGKVVECKLDELSQSLPVKIELDESETSIVHKVKKGFINSLSIGATCNEKESFIDENGVFNPVGLNFEELSFVHVGGVPGAIVNGIVAENIKKEGSDMESNIKDSDFSAMKTAIESLKVKMEESAKLSEKIAVLEKELQSAKTKVDVPAKESVIKLIKEKDKDGTTYFHAQNWREMY